MAVIIKKSFIKYILADDEKGEGIDITSLFPVKEKTDYVFPISPVEANEWLLQLVEKQEEKK